MGEKPEREWDGIAVVSLGTQAGSFTFICSRHSHQTIVLYAKFLSTRTVRLTSLFFVSFFINSNGILSLWWRPEVVLAAGPPSGSPAA